VGNVKLHTRLFIALIAGGIVGVLLHPYADAPAVSWTAANILRPIGQIFLRSIFMIVVPMVFSALVIGVYELRQGSGLPGVAGRTLMFTTVLSSASVIVGLLLVNAIRPGDRLNDLSALPPPASVETLEASAAAARPLADTLIELVPRNPLDSAVRALEGEMLPLMVFALAFGAALSYSAGRRLAGSTGGETAAEREGTAAVDGDAIEAGGGRGVLIAALDDVFEACMAIIRFVMRFAPIAVFALVCTTTITFGTGIFGALGLFVVTVVSGLLIQQFGVYALALWIRLGQSPFRFFARCREVYLYAFATSSSNATLPLSIQVAETKLALPRHIARFVLTVGSTANQNGTALFEGITVVFLAQAYGVDLGVAGQLQVMLMSIVAGIGTAGVPGGSLPMILLLAQSVGVPGEGLGLILGVDRFLDMCRTTVNVSGDLVIAALVSGRERGTSEPS
jgi:DAACS family dicarboxylate/amino acid:cation (Na+ or H+) symporter